MKHKIKSCFATTGLSLVILSLIATLYEAQFLCITTVFQVLLANAVIHLGLSLLNYYESNYFLLEILLEIGYTLIILILFGYLFDWYSSTPLWILILMGISIYFIGCLIGIFNLNTDLTFINTQLSLKEKDKIK